MHHVSRPIQQVATDVKWPEYDLRGRPCPEPMQRALEFSDALEPGESVCVLTPLWPTPLLEVLDARGLQTRVYALASGGMRVLISRPDHDGTAGA
ncbi:MULTISPECIES: DUF2249 domain-containing protein [unclassified Rhodanobacter]|uniref:DUF2249 domain-containing protein n=1 Tax=unclassified Rhodanobacter TaxID=2621553 RepID=UPI000987320F|nr:MULTISPECIES: DUF2249 domain-containing protein [unclassified Rhodanobacter]OOG38551.1 hypothetical protein B0E51_13425 [Rhodanobacter sp. C05]OOG50110.1 hypothetical protein B0E50_02955 [Rhodanobacter sp. C01]OOG52296.1 hypothetical protein B0E48_17145 [Rhodanobacter sp. C03]OOG65973.1 hypothetical protein B0E46_00195 [Rhodanobacter sp. B04]